MLKSILKCVLTQKVYFCLSAVSRISAHCRTAVYHRTAVLCRLLCCVVLCGAELGWAELSWAVYCCPVLCAARGLLQAFVFPPEGLACHIT